MNQSHPKEIAIHPIALLSIVDHFNRSVGIRKNKRVLGVLLGNLNSKSRPFFAYF